MSARNEHAERRKADLVDKIHELEQSFKKQPDDSLLPLARAYLSDGRTGDAIRILERGKNGKVETDILLAQAFFDGFQNNRASEIMQAAVNKGGLEGNVPAQLLLGEIALEADKPDEAKEFLQRVMILDAKNHRAASLLQNLGEDIEVPELPPGEEEDWVGFRTGGDEAERPLKALGQIVLVAALLSGALGFYLWNAKRTHRAKTLAVEAMPLVDRGDVDSLAEAERKYREIIELSSSDPYALSGLAYLKAMLWVDHGIAAAEADARDFTARAKAEGIERGDRYAAEALLEVGDGRHDRAIDLIKAVAARGGVQEKLYWVLGLSLSATGKHRAAREDFRKAHELRFSSPHFATALADAYELNGDRYNAALYWGKAYNSNSSYIKGAARQALARGRRGEDFAVIDEELQRLLAFPAELLGPKDLAAIHSTYAQLLYRDGRYEDASKSLEAAIAADSKDITELPSLLALRAQIALMTPELTDEAQKQAFADLDAARVATANAPLFLHQQIEAFIAGGKTEEALAVLGAEELAATMKSSFKLKELRARVLRDGKRYDGDDGAIKAYDAILAQRQEDSEALLGRAIIDWRRRKYDDAIKWFERAVSARPEFPKVYESIGLMFIEQRATRDANTQLVEAERLYKKANVGSRVLSQFYARTRDAFAAKRSSFTSSWQARIDALATPAK